ncbi:uncharacterized protein BX663DRAFT_501020 [Cokeromyces recurvatus]|uniref:uncharacterized protein n=1 Tax=Cokeromyces recurvatus TaxID=90255 RepID=UPI00222017F9|nr:uncharacterized protein BX663DRAFT_501020 [Cokeromyces recurvatus]KAI7904912.1 hypothetical protein BX663DRAFT_501020 [Cokeromyces recurvatus]
MQVLPLLTPTNFTANNKKRSRSSTDEDDDFECHYLKKRLISTISDITSIIDNNEDRIEQDEESFSPATKEKNDFNNSRIQSIDVNGTLLPMEQRPGEVKYSIPDFILNKQCTFYNNNNKSNLGELTLYNKGRQSWSSIEEEEKYNSQAQPMEID